MLFFRIFDKNNVKAFDEKMQSYEFRIEYLCNADSILFCSICYNDAVKKLEKLKDIAEEINLYFDYNNRLNVLKEYKYNCFDAALAKEIEKILDDLVENENIDRFQARLENLESDYHSNYNYFSENGDELYEDFVENGTNLVDNYRDVLFF